MILHVDVKNKVATFHKCDGGIVCENSGYQIEFNFDSEWDGVTTKVARFIYGGTVQDVTFTGDTCDVPIIPNTEKVIVGVFTEDRRMTTTGTEIPCEKSILCR